MNMMQDEMDLQIVISTKIQVALNLVAKIMSEEIPQNNMIAMFSQTMTEQIQFIKSGGKLYCYDKILILLHKVLFDAWRMNNSEILMLETLKFIVEYLSTPIESNQAIAASFNPELIDQSFNLLKQTDPSLRPHLKQLIHRFYLRFPSLRATIRSKILDFLQQIQITSIKSTTFKVPQKETLGTYMSTIPPHMLAKMQKSSIPLPHTQITSLYLSPEVLSKYNGLSEVLEVLASIVAGCKSPLKEEYIASKGLLYYAISLHSNPLLIDELTSVLSLYHKVTKFHRIFSFIGIILLHHEIHH